MSQENPDDLDRVFKALGNLTRRRILRLLAQKPRYPYELSKMLGLTGRGVQKHLIILQDAGLVDREQVESELGPDRIYYKLNVSFGLSTTILPNAFVVRLHQAPHPFQILRPRAAKIPEPAPDVKAVRALLQELDRVNKKLGSLDEERMRHAELRGRIIRRTESIMEHYNWDQESCQRVRALLNPVRSETSVETDLWTESFREAHELIENLLSGRSRRTGKTDEDEEKSETAVSIEFE
ncbi:MAG: helix-turn-helix domain-containing protein [Candidatus Thorarchaeota archaeon]|nr:MAG: helix-turn-helix domain-containing protein [Candidatus Thorarchaeota archaeon]